MKIYIIDSNNPDDHYSETADGEATKAALKTLYIKADLKLALDKKRFRLAITRALKAECSVLHISCHGEDEGLVLCDDTPKSPSKLSWSQFSGLFQGSTKAPKVLVLSACKGASINHIDAFAKCAKKPMFIIGSTDRRRFAEYLLAWMILYRRFESKSITGKTVRRAIRDICAVIRNSFVVYRWSKQHRKYVRYPSSEEKFSVRPR